MAKRKLTPKILETIELCVADAYTLNEIREEANITKPLMEDPRVLEAIERGRVEQFIEIMADNGDIENFMYYANKTPSDVDRMLEANRESIELRKVEVKEEEQETENKKRIFAERMMYPAGVSAMNITCQMPENERSGFSNETLRDEIQAAAKRVQEGDNTALLEVLIGNISQMHLFNGHVTQNLMGDLGKQLSSFEKLSSIQLKVMQETRKSIMAINEITNPKRTTFIKEANQHNHLHQNSEKKEDNSNELQQLEEPGKCDSISDVEILSLKEKPNEKEFH